MLDHDLSVPRFDGNFGGLFSGGTAASAEQSLEVSAKLFDVFDQHAIALRGLGQQERALHDGEIQHREAFGIESSSGCIKRFGFREIGFKIFGNPRQFVLAETAKFRMGKGQFLGEHAHQAAFGQALRTARSFFRKIKPPENAVQWVGESAERRLSKLVCLQFVKTNNGCRGQIVLALKVMKERALGDPCRSADIIDGGGVESAVAHETDAGIDELAFCFGQLVCLRLG